MATAAVRASATELAGAARLIAAAGLVEGFGHVSARAGDGMLITSTAPLGASEPEQVHEIAIAAAAGPGAEVEGLPLEWPLHAAIYRSRPDIGAICRTHSPAAVAHGVRAAAPPLLHGLGGLAGEVAAAEGSDLVTTEEAAEALAAALGGADCMLIRANGAVATGADLPRAVCRAWFLEERCRVALAAGPGAEPLAPEQIATRSRWYEAELQRAWTWLRWRYGDAGRGRPAEVKRGAAAPEGERG